MEEEGKVQINVSWNCLKDKLMSLNLTVTTLQYSTTIYSIYTIKYTTICDMLQLSIVTQEIPNALFGNHDIPITLSKDVILHVKHLARTGPSFIIELFWILTCQQSRQHYEPQMQKNLESDMAKFSQKMKKKGVTDVGNQGQ